MVMRSSLLSAWLPVSGIVLIVLSASCSKQPDAPGQPTDMAGGSARAERPDLPSAASGESRIAEAAVAPESPPDGPRIHPGALDTPSIGELAEPVIPFDLPSDAPAQNEAADAATPFDLPSDMLFQMDEPAGDAYRGGSARTPDVHFVPTPQEVVDRMLALAQVSKDDVVYDLGCGDGRIVVTAAEKFGCRAVGVDIDPQRVKESLKNVREHGVEELVEIKEADIFELDLAPASVITLYLLPDLNVRLIPQLEKLKPGIRIVSHAFDMRGVTPEKTEKVEAGSGRSHTIYLWTTPLKKQE